MTIVSIVKQTRRTDDAHALTGYRLLDRIRKLVGEKSGVSAARPELVTFSACAIAFIVADTLVCTALSGVHDRYQARVTWLLPLAAMMLLIHRPSIKRSVEE